MHKSIQFYCGAQVRIPLFKTWGSHRRCRFRKLWTKIEKLLMSLYDCIDHGRTTGNLGPNLWPCINFGMQKLFLCLSPHIYRPHFSHLPEFSIWILWVLGAGCFQYVHAYQMGCFRSQLSACSLYHIPICFCHWPLPEWWISKNCDHIVLMDKIKKVTF